MSTYLYLSLVPEALIASMLEPASFGSYLATGSRRSSSGPAIFFELDYEKLAEPFGLGALETLCKPHEYGTQRRSSYLAIYRVLERLPVEAVRALYLTTRKGDSLRLEPGENDRAFDEGFFLYQELGPVSPRVVSRLNPRDFATFLTREDNPLRVPKIVFADLKLGELATDPERGNTEKLPYSNIPHLRECLELLVQRPEKSSKVVNRDTVLRDLYPNIASGVYFGNGKEFLTFEMPDTETLAREHNLWWMSAQSQDRF
ncbi:MAG: hypothetical protein ACLFUF_03295 [Opitutales bacterium]